MTSSNGNIFRVTDLLCGEFTGHRWIPLTKASDAEVWCFSLICAWTNSWAKNGDPGDLRRHRAHYGVTALKTACISRVSCQKGPTRHAYAWQIGPLWQDILDTSWYHCHVPLTILSIFGLDDRLQVVVHLSTHAHGFTEAGSTWKNKQGSISPMGLFIQSGCPA